MRYVLVLTLLLGGCATQEVITAPEAPPPAAPRVEPGVEPNELERRGYEHARLFHRGWDWPRDELSLRVGLAQLNELELARDRALREHPPEEFAREGGLK